jgi:hypothetical protein
MAEEEQHPAIVDLPAVDAESLAFALSLHRELNAPTRRTRREQPEDAAVARKRPSSATKKAKRAKKEEDSEGKSGETGHGKDDGEYDDDKEEDSVDTKDNKDGVDKKKKKEREKQGQLEGWEERPKSASKRKANNPYDAKEPKKPAKMKTGGGTNEEEGEVGYEAPKKKKRRKKEPASDSNYHLAQPDTTRAIKKQQSSLAHVKSSRSTRNNMSNNAVTEGRDDSKDLMNIQEEGRIDGDGDDGDGDMTALAGAASPTNGAPGKSRGRPPGRSKASKKGDTSNKTPARNGVMKRKKRVGISGGGSRKIPEHVRLAAEHRKLAAGAGAGASSLLAEGTVKCFLAGYKINVLLQSSSFTDRATLAAAVNEAFFGLSRTDAGEKIKEEVKEEEVKKEEEEKKDKNTGGDIDTQDGVKVEAPVATEEEQQQQQQEEEEEEEQQQEVGAADEKMIVSKGAPTTTTLPNNKGNNHCNIENMCVVMLSANGEAVAFKPVPKAKPQGEEDDNNKMMMMNDGLTVDQLANSNKDAAAMDVAIATTTNKEKEVEGVKDDQEAWETAAKTAVRVYIQKI